MTRRLAHYFIFDTVNRIANRFRHWITEAEIFCILKPLILKRISSTFGAGYFERLFLVILPAALPSILSGIRQGWSFAWHSLMAGELLYHSKSLGSLLSDARDMADYPALFAQKDALPDICINRTGYTTPKCHLQISTVDFYRAIMYNYYC